jgi:hypothetical protein
LLKPYQLAKDSCSPPAKDDTFGFAEGVELEAELSHGSAAIGAALNQTAAAASI